MASANSGIVNRVLSVWKARGSGSGIRLNVAVISTTDEEFAERIIHWAKVKGYQVEEGGRER
jgi:hypothetical protein